MYPLTQETPDAPVCSCPCASQLVTVTQQLTGGEQCMEPKKTVDNEPFPTPYVHSGGRSKLPCSRLSEVFPVGSYHQRSGGNTAWTVQPPYSVFVGASWQNAKYNSPFVCGSDRVCLPGESELFSLLESGGTRWITSGCSFFSCCRSYDLTFFCSFFHLLLVFFFFLSSYFFLLFFRSHAFLSPHTRRTARLNEYVHLGI